MHRQNSLIKTAKGQKSAANLEQNTHEKKKHFRYSQQIEECIMATQQTDQRKGHYLQQRQEQEAEDEEQRLEADERREEVEDEDEVEEEKEEGMTKR